MKHLKKHDLKIEYSNYMSAASIVINTYLQITRFLLKHVTYLTGHNITSVNMLDFPICTY